MPKVCTGQDVYEALCEQLLHVLAHISSPADDLTAVDVDGMIDCCEIAEFLNQRMAQ